MKNFLKACVLLAVLIFQNAQASSLFINGTAAEKYVNGSEAILLNSISTVPDYVRFKSNTTVTPDNFTQWLIRQFNLPSNYGFKLLAKENDKLGFVHYRLQQTVDGIPVEGTMYILHTKNERIESMNGQVMTDVVFPKNISVGEDVALQKALSSVGAAKYKWQFDSQEKALKEITGNSNATYFPKAEMVYVPTENEIKRKEFHLAYRFDIYAAEPLSRNYVYVDAANGNIIYKRNRIESADVQATAHTQYSGVRTITTDSYNSSYRLREAARGNGIQTYNAQHSTTPTNVDFTNATTDWNNVNANKDQYATDAHFASEMTYDFYYNTFGRNSIDDNGLLLVDYVHYDTNLDNAFWDGQAMNYGDGSTTYGTTPYTTLDVGGHEITHGLTQYTANLNYQAESGALNESFSDCMGTAIRQYVYQAANVDYLIGDQNGTPFRSMKAPKTYQQPNTYNGQYWASLSGADNGGVHTNSGVQNYWFYLVANGGTGTNDNSFAYNITGIGIDKAAAITFRSLTVYLTPSSQYADARTYSIQAATDLYGACSPEVITVANAWQAVGVGGAFNATVVADFAPNITATCSAPASVSFTNFSSNANNYSWDFGDGSGSTAQNPTHQYNTFGTYTVKLISSSPGCGTDSLVKTQLIHINDQSPVASGTTICPGQSAALTATGSGVINWYSTSNGGTALSSGTTYNTPTLNSTTTYYAENLIPGPAGTAAPATHNFGQGGYNTYMHYQVFDNHKPQTLISVSVDAGAAGNRTIVLSDANGNGLDSVTVNLTTGVQTVTLNFHLPVANSLQLGIYNGTSNLYRNSSGAMYPYYSTDSSLVITSNDVPDLARFYFFYNWQLQQDPCISNRTPVTVTVVGSGSSFTTNIAGTTVDFTPSNTTAVSYFWNFGDGNTSTQSTPSHTYTSNGTYTVQLIESNGTCTDTVTQTVNIGATGVTVISGLQKFELMPNPVYSQLNVRIEAVQNLGNYEMKVLNILGETITVLPLSINAGVNTLNIDASQLAGGVYFLSLQNGTSITTKRFVKAD